ncbi:hypothetical protein STEG23_029656 [Scotinomys teguina]
MKKKKKEKEEEEEEEKEKEKKQGLQRTATQAPGGRSRSLWEETGKKDSGVGASWEEDFRGELGKTGSH